MWGEISVFIHYALALVVSVRVIMRPRLEPSVRLAWLLVVLAVPFVGTISYILFGEVRLRRSDLQNRRDVRDRLTGRWQPGPHDLDSVPEYATSVVESDEAVGGFPAVEGNELHLLAEDDTAIDDMVAAIDQARSHVHILFYIWLPDDSGQKIVDATIRAARRGVAVRIIVDAVGSRLLVKSPFWQQMKDAGVRCEAAFPVIYPVVEVLFQRVDLRNHRKIVVIDGTVGFTGSRNCADMAFAVKPRFAPWIDILVRLEGPVVRQLQAAFLSDWISYTGHDLGDMLDDIQQGQPSGAIAQVVATGPDRRNGSISDCITTLIYSARKELTITTPYYVPDPALDAAIRSAARRGVKVTMILPERNDSVFVNATSEGFWQGLILSGVHMHLYRGGLLHSKIITVDGKMAMIGSANLDRRSFEINYELNVMVIDAEFVAELDERQGTYLYRSRYLNLSEVRGWPWWRRARNNILALAAPLL